MVHMAASTHDNDNGAPQPPPPGLNAAAPDQMLPQPVLPTPIPGPQPGFRSESDFNLHQIHYNDLYAPAPGPAPAAANYVHHQEQHVSSDPVKPQPTFSAQIPGPQPGYFSESTNMFYQPAAQPGFSAPVLGPQPGFFIDQNGRYLTTSGGGPAMTGPHVRPNDPVTLQPVPIQVYQTPIQHGQIQRPSYNVPWNTGLFDCFDDPMNAIITLCVPCVTFGQAAEIIDQGSTSCGTHAVFYSCVCFLIGCPCILSCSYRTKLRAKYDLMESPTNDFLTHFVCELCALCQMYRELASRGIDPSIGWQGNVQRQQQQQQQQQNFQMTAPPRQAMM